MIHDGTIFSPMSVLAGLEGCAVTQACTAVPCEFNFEIQRDSATSCIRYPAVMRGIDLEKQENNSSIR